MSDVEDWWPLQDIAEKTKLWSDVEPVEYKRLHGWSRKAEANGFPAPKRSLGRYHFYDAKEVYEWLVLYQRIAKRYEGQGLRLHSAGGQGHSREEVPD